MKYNYYDYLNFVNGKKVKKEREIDFDVFYQFYEGAVKHAQKQAKKKRLNLNNLLLNEKFYLKYAKEKYFYNEESVLDKTMDVIKMGMNVNKNIAKDKLENVGTVAKEAITSTETGEALYAKMAKLGNMVSFYLKTVGIMAPETTKTLVYHVYNFVNAFMKKILFSTEMIEKAKNNVISSIEEGIAEIISKFIGGSTNKNDIIKNIRQKEKEISDYFNDNEELRLAVGCLLAAGICYIWTQSATTGSPLLDFNIDIYIKLMTVSVPLFSVVNLMFLIELIVFFIITKIKSIATYLPNWFGLAGNLTVVGGLLLTAYLLKKIGESNDPDLVKFKGKICSYLNKPKEGVIEKAQGDLANILSKIGEKTGVINPNSNLSATCPV